MDPELESAYIVDITPKLLKAVALQVVSGNYDIERPEDVARRIINIVFDHMNPETSNESASLDL